MWGVVDGLGVIVTVIALGFLLARTGTLGAAAQHTLSRLVFFVATPALLFQTLGDADLHTVVSPTLAVTVVITTFIVLVYVVVARWVWHRPVPEVTIGALAASYVNSGNLGVPIAVYVLGDASYVAPVMLYQLVMMVPVAFAVLDTTTTARRGSCWRLVSQPLRNPVIIASALGLTIASMGWEVPPVASRPIDLLAGMAVPASLIAYGVSLYGAPMPGAGGLRRDITLAVTLKVVVQPALAYLLAAFVLGLDGEALLAATLTAALPTAQNIVVHAIRYGTAVTMARDSIFLSTVLSAPVLVLIAAALA